MADEGRIFLVALNRNLTDATALGGELPENLRAAADSYSQGQVDGLLGDKAPINNPTFTGTVGGITKSMVGLGNVDNTSDANKPISSATQAALDDKLDADETLLPVTTSGWSEIRAVTAAGASVRISDITVTPAKYGCAGDGTADDTTKLNTMISDVRALISNERVRVKIDLNGGVYKVTGNGLNMTGLKAWNFEVCNGVILGHTTGKPVIDLVGSRGYVFRNVLVYGDETDMPTLPILCARGTATADAFCDNAHFDNVTCFGYYSVAAFYEYAQETTRHSHCRYWNSNPDAYVAILEGKDAHPQTSVNKTVLTGSASHINSQYDIVDFRYQPVGKKATITSITKANPAVVTCSGGHPFSNGQSVAMWLINGMTEMNGASAVISNVTATTFEMTGINSTGWGSFTSGTAVRMASKPAIYMNRMEQHHFRTCYVATWADHAIEIDFVDTTPLQQCQFDFLFEGVQTGSEVKFLVGTNTRNIRDTVFSSYNTHAVTSYFSTDAGVGGQIAFYGGAVRVSKHSTNAALPLVDNAAKYAFLAGTDIFYPSRAGVTPSSYSQPFRADVSCIDDGEHHIWGARYRDVSSGSFSPTVAAAAGAIATLGTVSGYAVFVGEMVWVEYSITITDNGTGSDHITATLPVSSASGNRATLNGRETATGQQLQGYLGGNATAVEIRMDDNNYPGASGTSIFLSGWYRRAA